MPDAPAPADAKPSTSFINAAGDLMEFWPTSEPFAFTVTRNGNPWGLDDILEAAARGGKKGQR